MAKQTEREYFTDSLDRLYKKLSAENRKSDPDPVLIKGFTMEIEKIEAQLAANTPDLDGPHEGFNWNAVG